MGRAVRWKASSIFAMAVGEQYNSIRKFLRAWRVYVTFEAIGTRKGVYAWNKELLLTRVMHRNNGSAGFSGVSS